MSYPTLAVGRFLIMRHNDYGMVIYEVTKNGQPCTCGGNDSYVLEVASDLNWGSKNSSDGESQFYPEDYRMGLPIKVCHVKLMEQVHTTNEFSIQPAKFDAWRRRVIAYNNSGDPVG